MIRLILKYEFHIFPSYSHFQKCSVKSYHKWKMSIRVRCWTVICNLLKSYQKIVKVEKLNIWSVWFWNMNFIFFQVIPFFKTAVWNRITSGKCQSGCGVGLSYAIYYAKHVNYLRQSCRSSALQMFSPQ